MPYEKFTESDEELLTPGDIGLLVRHGKLSEAEIKELDRSDPMELPAKLEREMRLRKQIFEEMENVEVIEGDPPDPNDSE